MVTIISDTVTWIQFALTCVIMVGMLTLIIMLDYYKKTGKKGVILSIAGVLGISSCVILGFTVIETMNLLDKATNSGLYMGMLITAILTAVILVLSLGTIVYLESLKSVPTKKKIYSVIFTVLLLIALVLIVAVVFITFFIEEQPYNTSLHIGSIVGFPALIMLSVGTILVIFDEPKFVIYHGLTGGGAWLLTLLNVLFLFTLSFDQMTGYSGIIHTIHILCGAVGLTAGFFSALFGLSGQRKLAKLTGYMTLGCWWTAYMLSTFIVDII